MKIKFTTFITASVASFSLILVGACMAGAKGKMSNPKAYIYSIRTVSSTPDRYCSWPTVTRLNDGELLAVYSGNREWHICPYGRVELMRSSDDGQSWSGPRVVIDTILDDRDAGICQTKDGTLLVTWFTSTAWFDRLAKAEKAQDEAAWIKKQKNANSNSEFRSKYEWPEDKIKRWQKMRRAIETRSYKYPQLREYFKSSKPNVTQWMVRSDDGGKSWSEPYPIPAMSPHGPICTSEGRLLLAGKRDDYIGLWGSMDDGRSWSLISKIPPMHGQRSSLYHELHVVEAADGTIIVQIRNHNKTFHYETLQTESKDGGKSWTEPHSIGVWGYPSHLLCLSNGDLLMTYGYRGGTGKPSDSYRVEARLSNDNGKSWSAPITIADNLYTWDFGYPSTVELGNGKLLTIWYEVQSDSPNAVLRQAIWKITGNM